ncbi:hypothetical protein ALC56_06269, partial [Trachymyrmex septentrionalis]
RRRQRDIEPPLFASAPHTRAHGAPCLRRRKKTMQWQKTRGRRIARVGDGKRVRFPERIATLRTRGMRRYPHKTSKLRRE